ncbi:hypothetical protein ACXGQW_00675 [Wenyingzhuangia sp. IMCC45533]
MRESKPYIRRKSVINDGKKDYELSEWHRVWQYDLIENFYGFEKYGVKSYERTIKVDNEYHRIDSLIENIAIEFQHTLSVNIDEMNSRYIAHSKNKLIPYLVIDFTKYNLEEYLQYSLNNEKIKNKLSKWINSLYGKSNNLFIDFKDKIYRVINPNNELSYSLDKTYFLENLLSLEIEAKNILSTYNSIQKRREIIQLKKERLKQLEEIKILENNKLEEQLRLQRHLEKKRKYYNQMKMDDEDFKYYRKCFKYPIVKSYLKKYDNEIFKYHNLSETEDNIYIKTHTYYSTESNINIEYITYSEIHEKQNPYSKFHNIIKEFKYLYSEIKLNDKRKSIAKFKIENNKIKVINENQQSLF